MDSSYRIRWVRPGHEEPLETEGYRPLNLLGHADYFDLVLPQACGGQAECGTCRVKILEGEVTGVLGDERELMERYPKRFREGERLACRARPRSDLVVQLLAKQPKDLREG